MWLKLWIILLSLTACASNLPRELEQVRTGMDKDEVLQSAGDPKHTFRLNSQDYWTYVFFRNDQEWRRDVIFESGKVVRISQPSAKQNWLRDLENTTTMDDFEQKAHAHQKASTHFKPIDGSPADTSPTP